MRKRELAIGVSILIAAAVPGHAQEVRFGTLTCELGSLAVKRAGSFQQMACIFSLNNGGQEHYSGTFKRPKSGGDIKAGSRWIWTVYSHSKQIAPRSLAGKYINSDGSVGPELKSAPEVLVGGRRQTMTLQPVVFENGADIRLSAADFRLR
jgi:hypothetical protein